MTITRDDVLNALEMVEKGSMAQDENLGPANGAAEGSGSDGKNLDSPGDDMNAKYGNKKKKGKDGAMKSERETPEDFNKSLPPAVETKVEVSDFLKSLVDHNAACVDKLRDFVIKSDMAAEDRMEEVMENVEDLQKSVGNIGVVLKAICERIGVIENAPAAAPKAETTVAKSETAERTFVDPNASSEADATQEAGAGMYKSLVGKPQTIQKSTIAEAICDLVRKGEAADTDVINFETYNYIAPELDSKLRAVL